jgi:hypothetical protein
MSGGTGAPSLRDRDVTREGDRRPTRGRRAAGIAEEAEQ